MSLLTTKLDAVNLMLSQIGESPVNNISESGIEEAQLRLRMLDETNRELQSNKLSFNSYQNYELKKNNNDNYIYTPEDTLRVKAWNIGESFTLRGQRLYDRTNNTYDFTSNVTVELSILLEYEETPEPFRYYCAIKRSRKFVQRVIGSTTLSNFTEKEEANARNSFVDFEADVDRGNIFNDGLGDLSSITSR